MNARSLVAVGAASVLALVGVIHPGAVTRADSGTLSTSNTTVTYTHGPFLVGNHSGDTGIVTGDSTPTCDNQLNPCDDYALTVDVPAGTDSTQQINIQISWAVPAADFDLYVLNSSGNDIAQSATSNDPENATIPAVAGTYTIRVVPYTPADQSFTATINLANKPVAPSNAATPYSGIYPRFQTYPIPSTLGGNAGEPSIGANWDTGNVMYQAGLQTFRVGFNDATSPAQATWKDVSAANTSKTSLDAILFTDHNTGRTFVSQLTGVDSLSSFTDNDGGSWTPSQGGGLPSGVDHQSIGGGPYSKSATLPTVNGSAVTGYKDAVYYCSQSVAAAFCARSDNGGLTFNAGVPIYNIGQCVGLHGHVRVAPDGTVYVPNKNCGTADGLLTGGTQDVAVSTDNGLTWNLRPIPDSTPGDGDPSVSIGSDGTVYFGYTNGNGHAQIAVSHDRGLTWSKSVDVGAAFGIQNTAFPETIAGDGNRAAFAFLGTPTGGNYQDQSFPGIWHLYIATTYDGGATWATVDATPNDPVQRGSICTAGTTCGNDRNLLDFMDITTDKTGRVLVAMPDGCVRTCVTATTDATHPTQDSINSGTADATIIRQSGGNSLFSAYDTPGPTVPARPNLTATQTQANGPVTLSWSAPDNGGSPITGYQLYRGTSSGAEKAYGKPTLKTTVVDTKINSGVTYYYTVRAINAVGQSQASPEATPQLVSGTAQCTVPGTVTTIDAQGDQLLAPNNANLDLLSLSVAEPHDLYGPNNLAFTLNIADLSSLQPNSQYRVFWNTADGSGNRWYVGMNVDATGTVSYVYGLNEGDLPEGAPSAPISTTPALGGAVSADGTITIVVPKSGVGNPQVGDYLPQLQARSFAGQANIVTFGTAAAADVSPYTGYTVLGNCTS